MRINYASNQHFYMSVNGKKQESVDDRQIKHSNKPVELHISDILDISGKVPKLPGYMKDGKYYLEVPDELKNRELKTADTTQIAAGQTLASWQVDINETTYEKYGNSNFLNVHNQSLRDGYYGSLFVAGTDKVNSVFGLKYSLNGWNAHTTELSAARYEELREQVIKAFGNDKELLNKNLDSLDRAFAGNMERIAWSNANHLESERIMERAAKVKDEEPLWEPNKLATHKAFNWEKFRKNAESLMRQFAQEYIQQIKSGMSYTSAWDNAVGIMKNSTTTTSVNELSFSDFMILDSRPTSNATTKSANIIARNEQSVYFNTNPNLSEELRKFLK